MEARSRNGGTRGWGGGHEEVRVWQSRQSFSFAKYESSGDGWMALVMQHCTLNYTPKSGENGQVCVMYILPQLKTTLRQKLHDKK